MSIIGLLFALLSQDRFHDTNFHETHKFCKPLLDDFLKGISPRLVKKYGGASINFCPSPNNVQFPVSRFS